ncbi:hypothetical protein L2E82_39733 [Cichorium intybus]|uniref:Uncharacterized protein n=1 Tax=Cichorium intybus TaxID=13427 RepID=A0ACB9AJD5_CICIN|nr:hypothetical protein L2E82_39733 [Cichorium intybus]
MYGRLIFFYLETRVTETWYIISRVRSCSCCLIPGAGVQVEGEIFWGADDAENTTNYIKWDVMLNSKEKGWGLPPMKRKDP